MRPPKGFCRGDGRSTQAECVEANQSVHFPPASDCVIIGGWPGGPTEAELPEPTMHTRKNCTGGRETSRRQGWPGISRRTLDCRRRSTNEFGASQNTKTRTHATSRPERGPNVAMASTNRLNARSSRWAGGNQRSLPQHREVLFAWFGPPHTMTSGSRFGRFAAQFEPEDLHAFRVRR